MANLYLDTPVNTGGGTVGNSGTVVGPASGTTDVIK